MGLPDSMLSLLSSQELFTAMMSHSAFGASSLMQEVNRNVAIKAIKVIICVFLIKKNQLKFAAQ